MYGCINVWRYGVSVIAVLLLCAGCVTRHQLPQTERQLEGTVTTAERAYMALYREYQSKRHCPLAMGRVDEIYNAWRNTQRMLIDSVRAGAIEWAPE